MERSVRSHRSHQQTLTSSKSETMNHGRSKSNAVSMSSSSNKGSAANSRSERSGTATTRLTPGTARTSTAPSATVSMSTGANLISSKKGYPTSGTNSTATNTNSSSGRKYAGNGGPKLIPFVPVIGTKGVPPVKTPKREVKRARPRWKGTSSDRLEPSSADNGAVSTLKDEMRRLLWRKHRNDRSIQDAISISRSMHVRDAAHAQEVGAGASPAGFLSPQRRNVWVESLVQDELYKLNSTREKEVLGGKLSDDIGLRYRKEDEKAKNEEVRLRALRKLEKDVSSAAFFVKTGVPRQNSDSQPDTLVVHVGSSASVASEVHDSLEQNLLHLQRSVTSLSQSSISQSTTDRHSR